MILASVIYWAYLHLWVLQLHWLAALSIFLRVCTFLQSVLWRLYLLWTPSVCWWARWQTVFQRKLRRSRRRSFWGTNRIRRSEPSRRRLCRQCLTGTLDSNLSLRMLSLFLLSRSANRELTSCGVKISAEHRSIQLVLLVHSVNWSEIYNHVKKRSSQRLREDLQFVDSLF